MIRRLRDVEVPLSLNSPERLPGTATGDCTRERISYFPLPLFSSLTLPNSPTPRARGSSPVDFAAGSPAAPAHSPAGRKWRRGIVAVPGGRLAGEGSAVNREAATASSLCLFGPPPPYQSWRNCFLSFFSFFRKRFTLAVCPAFFASFIFEVTLLISFFSSAFSAEFETAGGSRRSAIVSR